MRDATGTRPAQTMRDEQALVSLKLKEVVDAEGWCTKGRYIEGG